MEPLPTDLPVPMPQGLPLPPAAPRPLRGPLPLTRLAERLPAPSDWSFELIDQYHEVIRHTAARFGLDTYPNQLEEIGRASCRERVCLAV